MVEKIIKIESCEKQVDFKGSNAESAVLDENRESTNQPVESSPFPAILDGLARNKPILDIISVTCLIMILAMIGVIVSLVILYGKCSSETRTYHQETTESPIVTERGQVLDLKVLGYTTKTSTYDQDTTKSPIKIVTRNEWLAQPPKGQLVDLKLPVHKIVIAHTRTEACTSKINCVATVALIQKFHMAPDSKNFDDIGYNFLVGADGNIYEGRGWDKQGANTKVFNQDSICIAFIGMFTYVEAPEAQLDAARRLIALGVQSGKIDQNYRLYGHRQLAPLESPGQKLYEQIKQWPHWSNQLR